MLKLQSSFSFVSQTFEFLNFITFFKKHSPKPSGSSASPPKSSTQPSYGNSPYRPLRQDVDSIRLIRIHSATSDADPIVCDLTEAPLGERPRFEALSYTWGDQRVKKTIILNGLEFHVGSNLFDALQYLRRRGDGTLFWIDAICIHQEDIPERNKQLRIMNHIYFRASTVVVWLGQKYVQYQAQISKARSPPEKQALGRQMVKHLIENSYWSRLWIIQEIGRATKLQVSFGVHVMAWDAFIAFIRSHSSHKQGPLRLARQVDRKYAGAHNLRELLYTHRKALCQDPRDKVYGLVGFAFDSVDFPIDYRKSPMDVWIDTLDYMDKNDLFDKRDRDMDVAFYSSLLKYLLLGSEPSHIQQNSNAHAINRSSKLIKNAWNSRIDPTIFETEGRGIEELKRMASSGSRAPANFNQATARDYQISRDQSRDGPVRVRCETSVFLSHTMLGGILDLMKRVFAPSHRVLACIDRFIQGGWGCS